MLNAPEVDFDDENRDITAEVDAMMKKFDLESNTRIWEGWQKWVVMTISACFAAYCIWSTLYSVAGIEERLTAFLGCIIIIGYLNYPRSKHHVNVNELPWYDIVLMLAGASAFFYYCFAYKDLVNVLTSASKMTPWFTAVGIIGVLSLMELCRRCVGLPILCVVGALLVYTFSVGLKLDRVIYTLFYGTSGVMGTPINVCAKFIVVFTIFGAFLERTGISNFFINLANCITGASSGGPAKVAVISSALCGMVSGSSVGNTVTTGSVTIPMMKKTGYKPEFAAAVEASASTGGQIMPPIMGAAAFLMAEYMNVTYAQVAMMAILPAFLYFGGIFMSVHLEAKRLGLKGIPRDELPKIGGLLKRIYLLTPLVLLVWLVSTNARTIQTSAALAIVATIVVSLFDKENRITPRKFFEAMEAGGRGVITVAVACAMAGIIAGCITVTGLASKLITAVVAISGSNLMVALFLTMICCIILGMGVPTTANYCIMATTCAPILISMGIDKIPAHFFVFYFGIVADITPPVALAAYAGAAIAKGNPMKTGITATKLAIAAFIIPYIFAMNPAMLFIDATVLDVVQITLSSCMGMLGVCMGLMGYLASNLKMPARLLAIFGGLLMIIPGTVTDLVGLVI
ncbi:MAG: TRAP transporter permease, partial [Oscillospiraceae bacterium]|nr:TRAP transporter permease [Oscillospiraceae bacterium]